MKTNPHLPRHAVAQAKEAPSSIFHLRARHVRLRAQSGIFTPHAITACTLFCVSSLLTYFCFAAPTTPTNTITVTSTSPVIAEDGLCTLPEAIIAANTDTASGVIPGECPAGSGADTIVLQSRATYTLVAPHNALYGFTGLPGVTSAITILGNGAIIQNAGATKFRLFYISPAGNLTLQNLTVSGGLAQGGHGGQANLGGGGGGGGGAGLGGAIYNQGALNLKGVTLSGNTARGGDGGLTLLGIVFGGAGGGGLGGDGGQSSDSGGSGGGGGMGGNGGGTTDIGGGGGGGANINEHGLPGAGTVGGAGGGTSGGNGGSFISLNGGVVSYGGHARGLGGGGGGGALAFLEGYGGSAFAGGGGGGGTTGGDGGFGGGGGGGCSATLAFGQAGRGGFGGGGGGEYTPWNGPRGGMAGSGMGGAIFNDWGATLTIFNSTLSGNSAVGGIGGASSGSGGRGGSGYGGAIFNLNGTVTINFSTIASNTVTAGVGGTGGSANGIAGTAAATGLYNYQIIGGTAMMKVQNAILAGTDVANCANEGGASFTSGGYNLVQTPGTTCGFTAVGDLTGVDPMLGALAANGGPTNTHALLAGSAAIERIPDAVNGCQGGLSVDQRAAPRAGGGAGLGGIACDTGAYEFDSIPTLPLLSVVSTKVHGSAGMFDVDLPLAGNPGIECRSGGANGDYSIVFTFANNLVAVASASASGCGGSVSNSGIGPDPNQYTVNLTGVSNACYITVTLTDVLDSAGNLSNAVSGTMGVLVGDVNSTGRTDSGDVTQVRNHTVSIPDQQTFRFDVNASGRIDAGDVTATRNATVTVLPP
jgi:hypothetical protein